MSAARSGLTAPPGRSATIVASAAVAGTCPMATPPSFTKASRLRSLPFPAPTITRRGTASPAGARMSRVEPFLPLNRAAAAARVTRSPHGRRIACAAAPNLSPSPQNMTRTPLTGALIATNSSFKAPDMREFVLSGRDCHLRIWAPCWKGRAPEPDMACLPCPRQPPML